MLSLIQDVDEKRALQASLHEILTRELELIGNLRVGFRGGNAATDLFLHRGSGIWYGSRQLAGAQIPRSWNVFGYYHPEYHSQEITVEINIATENDGAQVAGYFAKDDETGQIYVMHSGKIGGGRKGVSQKQFLGWLDQPTVRVKSLNGAIREGLIVAPLGGLHMVDDIVKFVARVGDFKIYVRSDQYDPVRMQTIVDLRSEFSDEFSGTKTGKRAASFDYYTYHGTVVRALWHWRKRHLGEREIIANSGLIDLFVHQDGALTEVYEVKTSVDRQSLYTAIGQVCVHGAQASKSIVVPNGFDLPPDIRRAVANLGIRIVKYTIDDNRNCEIRSRYLRH